MLWTHEKRGVKTSIGRAERSHPVSHAVSGMISRVAASRRNTGRNHKVAAAIGFCHAQHQQVVNASRPGSIGEGARFLNKQLSNRLFGKTAGLSQLFEFLSLLQYKVRAPCSGQGASTCPTSPVVRSKQSATVIWFNIAAETNP